MPEKITEIWESVKVFIKDYVIFPLKSLNFIDILDILVLSMLIYVVYKFIKEKRASRLASGVGLLIIIYVLSDLIGMIALSSILKNFYAVGIMAICVIFQPELREVLEEFGSTSINLKKRNKKGKSQTSAFEEATLKVVEEISAAAFEISSKGDGALIVIERASKLKYQMSEGTHVDAVVSRQLLSNIFVNKAPLHDGAVIIRNGRIVSASCKSKTISENDDVLEGLGTRHRAAVRISEISDAIVVVVSEETGTISVANNKLLKRDYNDIGIGGKHKSTDLRDDLFKLMTGRTVEDMVSSSNSGEAELIVDDDLKDMHNDIKGDADSKVKSDSTKA